MGRQAIARPRLDAALRDALVAFVVSRAFVWVVGVLAVAVLGADAHSASAFDRPELTHPFGPPLDTLFSPLARWDSVWYLGIAHDGYAGSSTAFFPLYPLLVRLLAAGSTPWALLLAGYVVSLGSFAGALVLLRRLTELELGADAARRTVFLVAFFPGALWFGVPYSESLFLLLSVGALYAARTDRWAWAGACAALASGTRSAGIVLLVPLAMMAWRRRDRAAAWLALAPAGLAAYSGYLAATHGDAFAYLHLQDVWFRSFAGPFGAIADGARAAWDGALQLLSGSRDHVYFSPAGGDPFIAAAHNLELFGFLVFAVVAAVGVVRRLRAPYGAYVVAALALPLSFPVAPQPLMSLPRFLAVLFPLFMWIALKPRASRVAFGVFVLLLGVFTVRYATWHWVA
jgi:Mannosyltransferase (PIG-V)